MHIFRAIRQELLGFGHRSAVNSLTMSVISTTKELQAVCDDLAKHPYITIDTEFLRDRTYYPKLCLVQLAAKNYGPVAVDPLADGIDLMPLTELLDNENVIKVFHAARQDMEIFYNMTGKLPHPIFDTQVAAMVCGYGEQIGYNSLVQQVCGQQLDKGAQFTDWSRRPLSKKQLSYALDDVTYLRDVYENLNAELEKRQRKKWVFEEMGILTAPTTYDNPPEDAWQRIKIKSQKPRVLAVLREVAAWREREAQRRNVPRTRVMRDETLADLSIHPPKAKADLKKIRSMPGDVANGKFGDQVMQAIEKAKSMPEEQCPVAERKRRFPPDLTPVLEMMKMLLRIQASEHEVAARLIANTEELQQLAMNDNAEIPPLTGWRYEVFGKEALALKQGKIALSLKNNKIQKKHV